mgnify:CR=1 FL=1
MDQMAAYTFEDLVSQAESRGVTLAEVLSSELSAKDMDEMQSELGQRMSENYSSIERFMAGVEVSSIADFSGLSTADLDEFQAQILAALSDDALPAHC